VITPGEVSGAATRGRSQTGMRFGANRTRDGGDTGQSSRQRVPVGREGRTGKGTRAPFNLGSQGGKQLCRERRQDFCLGGIFLCENWEKLKRACCQHPCTRTQPGMPRAAATSLAPAKRRSGETTPRTSVQDPPELRTESKKMGGKRGLPGKERGSAEWDPAFRKGHTGGEQRRRRHHARVKPPPTPHGRTPAHGDGGRERNERNQTRIAAPARRWAPAPGGSRGGFALLQPPKSGSGTTLRLGTESVWRWLPPRQPSSPRALPSGHSCPELGSAPTPPPARRRCSP